MYSFFPISTADLPELYTLNNSGIKNKTKATERDKNTRTLYYGTIHVPYLCYNLKRSVPLPATVFKMLLKKWQTL